MVSPPNMETLDKVLNLERFGVSFVLVALFGFPILALFCRVCFFGEFHEMFVDPIHEIGFYAPDNVTAGVFYDDPYLDYTREAKFLLGVGVTTVLGWFFLAALFLFRKLVFIAFNTTPRELEGYLDSMGQQPDNGEDDEYELCSDSHPITHLAGIMFGVIAGICIAFPNVAQVDLYDAYGLDSLNFVDEAEGETSAGLSFRIISAIAAFTPLVPVGLFLFIGINFFILDLCLYCQPCTIPPHDSSPPTTTTHESVSLTGF